MVFESDNLTGPSPEILDAVIKASAGDALPYGEDVHSQTLGHAFSRLFETEVMVFPVFTGTAANALALAAAAPPWGAIYCHEAAHIALSESGAPEFFTGGAKLLPRPGSDGKLDPADLARHFASSEASPHHAPVKALSIAEATECGTLYDVAEVGTIGAFCRAHDLVFHMDGARFANAVSALGVTPAELTWRSGIDVLSFGATKNGAMGAEAVVFFRRELARDFANRWKRAGQLASKMRFLAVQLETYVRDKHWLRNAGHANAMAARLAQGLARLPGVRLLYPAETNAVFAVMPEAVLQRFAAEGVSFRRWASAPAGTVRLVTAFNTPKAAVDDLLARISAVLLDSDTRP